MMPTQSLIDISPVPPYVPSRESLWYYMNVAIQRMLLGSLSIACVLLSERLEVNLLGAVIMAIFWQQCGWLAHDFLHHQVGSLWLMNSICESLPILYAMPGRAISIID